MKWHELTISTREEVVEAISDYLHEAGAGGVAIEESGSLERPRDTKLGQWYDRPLNNIPIGDAVIQGYFAEETEMEPLIAAIEPFIAGLREFDLDPGDFKLSYKMVDEEDWADSWKKYFKPIRVSERLTIRPTWEEYEAGPNERIIDLDPGMAFGTGTHPTTALCLRTLDSVIRGGEEVIDVGTGSGILAIGAMKLGAKAVLAVDLDPVAVSSAKENTRLNGLSEQIDVRLSDLLGVLKGETKDESGADAGPINVSVPVDVVVANILAEIIMLFIGDVYDALKPGGIYIASGIWKNKEEVVEQGLLQAGFEIVDRRREDDWIAFVASKPKAGE
ncbi:ribosomal protein L11 methyltransferase [Paenibacillus cellulosilyticus]|uniref:Ribosomal protein L11 methyltransferase n=1 Tax=Paenibacillus cellulosilyticus TaxID=375489 RepID=A0A2V2YPH1_9BACL|nr:50S ribosomal protein L11 methyltransferase [Paenibacillus cellulosilyticus]PWV98379.1 ribosomal protein L11 methyltransferase [Paenibacillus cellulosilyticus]QKS43230.1 50S ribosomal protein L11 methyltransferase [Paenibacillus cellulosilyticus]